MMKIILKYHLMVKINFDCQPMEGLFLVVMQMFFNCYLMIELIFGEILAKTPFLAKKIQNEK